MMKYNNRGLQGYVRYLEKRGLPIPNWLRTAFMPFGDKIICRDWRGGNRAVCRKTWAKLNDTQRGQWIERIRAEQRA
jgi:hypothetical protein